METGLYRSGMFMRMARKIFREEGIPENIAWLGQVESAWKPTARSWAAAAGLWQFIPGTGARYNLRQNGYVDERNSFEKATRASTSSALTVSNATAPLNSDRAPPKALGTADAAPIAPANRLDDHTSTSRAPSRMRKKVCVSTTSARR